MQDTSPIEHSWFRMIQRETCSILPLLSLVVNKQLHSLHLDYEERDNYFPLPSHLPALTGSRQAFLTTLIHWAMFQGAVCPLSGYYCEQLKFFPPHSQAQGFILPNSFNQICSLTAVQSMSNQFLNWDILPCHCMCWGCNGQQSPETYLRHWETEVLLLTTTWEKRLAE